MTRVAFLHVEDENNDPDLQRRLAKIMIASVRSAIPFAWLIQMSDFETPNLDGVDEIRRIGMDTPYFMNYRLSHLTHLKDETLILDTDVIVIENPADVFNMAFDVALTRRNKHIISKRAGYTEDDPLMEYNTGVMFSRNPAFWKDALSECEKLEERHQLWFGDQIAIAAVVNQRKYDVAVLPCEKWNYTPGSESESFASRKIVHFKGRARKQWMLELEDKDNLEAAMKAGRSTLELCLRSFVF